MRNIEMINKAKKLAKDIIRVELAIQNIIESNQSNFDVYQDEVKGWIIQTSFCRIGGCIAGSISSNSEESARKLAAKMTFQGLEPNHYGLCSRCRDDLMEMQI